MALEPTAHERTAAAAMHLGTIVAPVAAPLAALAIGSRSEFIAAHARRSLKETLVLQLTLLVLGMCSLAYSGWILYGHYQNDWQDFSVWPIIAKAAVIWALLAILQAVNAVQSVRQAIRAYQGLPAGTRDRLNARREARSRA